MDNALARLEAVCGRLEAAAAKMGAPAESADGLPAYVGDWNNICSTQLDAVVTSAKACKVSKAGAALKKCYDNLGALLTATATCAKPKQPDLMKFLAPAVEGISDAEKIKMKRVKRKKNAADIVNHRTAISEMCSGCAWVTMAPPMGLPAGHAQTQGEAADFHLNRVLKDAKNLSDDAEKEKHRNFVKACQALNKAVTEYVKTNFKTGLIWKAGGGNLLDAPAEAAAPAKPAAAKPAAKPAADDQKCDDKDSKKGKQSKQGDMGAVFGQLSKGLNVTSGLKKVSKDQKTKYRKKEAGRGLIKAKAKKASAKPKKNPVTKTQGMTIMFMDHYEGVVEVPAMTPKQNAFITGCQDCAMEFKGVSGRVKAVTVDSCKKVKIFVDSVVSSVELVNCKSVTIYVRGSVPSIQIDKSESPRVVVLPSAKTNPNLVVSCVTAGNVEVCVPTKEDAENMVEYPMPEQFTMKVLDGNKGLSCEQVTHG